MLTETPDVIIIPIKVMERYQTVQEYLRGNLSVTEATIRCRIGERQFFRLVAKVKKAEQDKVRIGPEILIHGNTGRIGNRALSEETKQEVKKLVNSRYPDFGPTLATEKLQELHNFTINSETLRNWMIEWDIWKPKRRRKNGKHREWRERRPLYGQMQQFDGCYHLWFEDRGELCCLLLSVDDATGRITGARFVEWEGVFPSFTFWRKYLKKHGKPGSIYLDKHSTYKINVKTLLDDPEARSQFERVCQELGIEVIHAHSAEAKGRVERVFKTLQDRLVKELRLRGISNKEDANRFLEEVFIDDFNGRFAVEPKESGDVHRTLSESQVELDQIFTIKTERMIMNDFTIRYHNRFFQLQQTTKRLVRQKEKVEVRETEDKTVSIHLRGTQLPSEELPERPKRVKPEPKLLAHRKPHKPAPDHPWRRYGRIQEKKSVATLSAN